MLQWIVDPMPEHLEMDSLAAQFVAAAMEHYGCLALRRPSAG